MFYKIISLVSLALLGLPSYACSVPISGAEYDSVINIEIDQKKSELYGETIYFISIPVSIDDAPFDSADLFLRTSSTESYVRVPFKLDKNDNVMNGEVSFYNNSNIEVKIHVRWGKITMGCPIIGKKLIKHNKSLKPGTPESGAP